MKLVPRQAGEESDPVRDPVQLGGDNDTPIKRAEHLAIQLSAGRSWPRRVLGATGAQSVRP